MSTEPSLDTLVQTAPSQTLPFYTHLVELRRRLLFIFCFLVVGTIVGYYLHDTILTLLTSPLDKPLYYSSPAGGLDFTLKLSFFFGLIASVPVFIYQTLQFIQPAFSRELKNSLVAILFISCLLLLSGMAFAYFVSLPAALYFLDTFNNSDVFSLISTNEYFSFVSRYVFGFGLLFQLPLALFVVNKIHKISLKTLMRYQKWVVLTAFLVAAILTPTPDVFNQALMAVPLIVLYQLTIVLLLIVNRGRDASPSTTRLSSPA
jgi:sec-independent protein translocase protein TatC